MKNMLRTDTNLWGETKERKMTDQAKENKDIKEDEERLKGQEKTENTCISSLIFLIIIQF